MNYNKTTSPHGVLGLMFLVFEVDAHAFAVRLESIQEIVPMARLIVPPGCPSILEGFLNLRGEGVPVLRLSRLLGLNMSAGLHTPLIVLRGTSKPLALLTERVCEIAGSDSLRFTTIPAEDSFNGCVEASAPFGKRTVLLLASDQLLIEQERQSIAVFQQRTQERIRDAAEASVAC